MSGEVPFEGWNVLLHIIPDKALLPQLGFVNEIFQDVFPLIMGPLVKLNNAMSCYNMVNMYVLNLG